MKWSLLSTSNLHWHSSLKQLYKSKPPKSIELLEKAGVHSLYDLLWIFPLRMQPAPDVAPFSQMEDKKVFLGKGSLVNLNITPAFGRRGKGNIQLFNADVIVQDSLSPKTITLKWFNTYPSFKNQFKPDMEFLFLGEVKEYRGQLQIVNPKINPKDVMQQDGFLIEYPTVNTVPGKQIKNLFDKIPTELWNTPLVSASEQMLIDKHKLKLNEAFKGMHGKMREGIKRDFEKRIIYEEFFSSGLKVLARKLKNQALKAPILEIDKKQVETNLKLFPYIFTDDQLKALDDVLDDIKKPYPMMRMIQGDVGCGKTSVATMAAVLAAQSHKQTAFMCPTETLARQHFKTIKEILPAEINIYLLVGSMKTKEKNSVLKVISSGEAHIVVGTHALIQDSVKFNDLGLAIIDEQHKFGVKQRQKLTDKGDGVHTLIMSATPIPRTLQLAQYGDLDISSIHTIPSGRKGTKTRIVTKETHSKYLSFLKTRLEMNEQIYIVAPAIEESEHFDVHNVFEIEKEYKKYFPEFSVASVHGQLKADDKNEIMERYKNGEIDLLISTTVIEVGIDNPNATVMSIFNPERFGLSSLHQLRGRVGRGDKPGFCFLVTDEKASAEAMQRLKILEQTSDGFSIAEADLKNRGQGELFGSSQSGYNSEYRLASIFLHRSIFDQVSQDIQDLQANQTEKLNNILLEVISDKKVSSTI